MNDESQPMTGIDFLDNLGAGTTQSRWLEEIALVAARCEETNGKGKVILEIEIEPTEDRIKYTPKIKSNLPAREQMSTSFFLRHGQISLTEPGQPELIPMGEQRPKIIN